jgi:glycosyltransferase involved in cell wall biosynthesis
MNLVFINPSRSRRPEIYELAIHFSKNYNITILQPSNKADSEGFYLCKNVYVRYVPSIFIHIHDLAVTIPLFKEWLDIFNELIRKGQCDLVHACDYEYLTSILPVLIKLERKIPIVIVNDALIGTNYSFGTSALDIFSRTYTLSFGKFLLKRYDKVVSLFTMLAVRSKKLGLSDERMAVIPNGIDIKKRYTYPTPQNIKSLRKKYSIADDEKVILNVGRLVTVKRVEIVLDVVNNLVKEGFKVKGLIVGSGPQRTNLEKKIEANSSNIIFTGFISEEEKLDCYSIADIFILPSISEGLPTVLLEAASFGIPLIATDTDGNPDIIINGETGFLVPRSNIDQYLDFTRFLLENEHIAKKMGANVKNHVEANFSWNIIAKKYEALFVSLIS